MGRFWVQRFGLAILLLTALVCAVNALSLSSTTKVIVLGSTIDTALQAPAVYQRALSDSLRSSIWNGNKLTINTAAVALHLQQRFPELASVTVTLPLLAHQPIVYLEPAHPALVISGSSGSYVLDASGRALLASASLSPLSLQKLPVVTDQSGLHIQLNQQILTSSDVTFVQTVVQELSARGFHISALTLPAATRELDVQLVGQPYQVKFNLQSGDGRQQAGTFLATQGRLQSQGTVPGQYIDVRVDGRAYYK
jgi:hypothetical protein